MDTKLVTSRSRHSRFICRASTIKRFLNRLNACGSANNKTSGLTLIELLIVIAIIVTLVAIGIPMYAGYIEKSRVYAAIQTIAAISIEAQSYGIDTGVYPPSLASFGAGNVLDPWGNPYQYLNIATANRGQMRKDRFLVPINTDFDLYSMGKDGDSVPALTAQKSRDDIIRANDGQFIGLAVAY